MLYRVSVASQFRLLYRTDLVEIGSTGLFPEDVEVKPFTQKPLSVKCNPLIVNVFLSLPND